MKIAAWEEYIFITGANDVIFSVYRETGWYFESKELLGKDCVPRGTDYIIFSNYCMFLNVSWVNTNFIIARSLIVCRRQFYPNSLNSEI
jgi:hypothetical protein